MADEQPEGGGFSLTKRYGPLPAWAWGLIGGVGLYAGYRFWKARQGGGAAAATAAPAGADQAQIDYAPQISTLQAEIQQLQGEEAAEPVDKDAAGGGGGGTGGGGGGGGGDGKKSRVRVPEVVGQRAAFAISTIEAAGLETVTTPPRNSRREYVVTGQMPKGGTMVPRRSVVNLRVRQTEKPAAPKPRRPAGQVRA